MLAIGIVFFCWMLITGGALLGYIVVLYRLKKYAEWRMEKLQKEIDDQTKYSKWVNPSFENIYLFRAERLAIILREYRFFTEWLS